LVVMLVMLLIVLGMFYTLQSHTRQESPQSAPPPKPPAAEIPVTPLPPSTGPKPPKQDEAKLLAQVRDDAAIEQAPYYHMLGKVFNMTQKEIDSKVDPSITPFDCLAEPKKHRGKFLRFDGSLWRLKETKMSPDSGFESVWEGTIARQGPPFQEYVFCTIVLTGRPRPEIQPEKSNVLFTGVFLKTIVYENRGEPDEAGRRNLTKSPLFIGKELQIATPPKVIGTSESLLYLFLGLAALAAFAYFVLFRREKSAHDRHFEMPSDEDMAALEAELASEEGPPEEPETPSEEEPSEQPDSPPGEEKPGEPESTPDDEAGEDEEPSSPQSDSPDKE